MRKEGPWRLVRDRERRELLDTLGGIAFGVTTIEFLDLAERLGLPESDALGILREGEASGELRTMKGRWVATRPPAP